MLLPTLGRVLAIVTCAVLAIRASAEAPPPVKVSVEWDAVDRVSRTTATLQVVVNPPLRRGSPIHDAAFRALRDLGADSVRFVPWLPYPRLAVAELEPPRDGRTSWDFSLIDPLVSDFYEATAGRPVVLNFSTTPQWLWKTPEPVAYPTDPDQVTWTYTQGNELRDPTAAEVAAVRAVSPGTKFVGASLAHPRAAPAFFEHFLDPKNHAPGTPLDMISYHFYATPSADQPRETQGFTAFEEAEGFLTGVRFIEPIRGRLSPATGTMVSEVGMIADHRSSGPPSTRGASTPGASSRRAAGSCSWSTSVIGS